MRVIRLQEWKKVSPWYGTPKYVLGDENGLAIAYVRKIGGLWCVEYNDIYERYLTLTEAQESVISKIKNRVE